jgi:hypothetical protein
MSPWTLCYLVAGLGGLCWVGGTLRELTRPGAGVGLLLVGGALVLTGWVGVLALSLQAVAR